MVNLGPFIAEKREALFAFGLPEDLNAQRWMLRSIVVAIAGAALLRIALADYSPWFDEFASLHFASSPVAELWGPTAVFETNPPLFNSMLAFWYEAGARSVTELRILPIFFGLFSILLAGIVAYRWLGSRAALIAVLLMGLSAQHIYYSHLLRAYMLAQAGILLSIAGLLMIVGQRRRGDETVGWGLHVVGSSLAIYCHTTMFLWPVIAAIAVIVIVGRQLAANRWHLLVALMAANLAIGAISAWWLWITFLQIQNGAENIRWLKPIGPREYVRQLLSTCMLTFGTWRDQLATNFIAVLTMASAIMLWRDRSIRLIAVLGLVAVVVFGLAGALKPILMPKTIFWMSLFPVLLISAGLGALRSSIARWSLVAVCVGLLVANLASSAAKFQLGNWREAVTMVARDRQALLLVRGPGMGVAVREACELYLDRSCPFPVIVLPVDPLARSRQLWAGPVKVTQPGELRQTIPIDRKVYSLRRRGSDPFEMLKVDLGGRTNKNGDPTLEGPIPASQVLVGR